MNENITIPIGTDMRSLILSILKNGYFTSETASQFYTMTDEFAPVCVMNLSLIRCGHAEQVKLDRYTKLLLLSLLKKGNISKDDAVELKDKIFELFRKIVIDEKGMVFKVLRDYFGIDEDE